VSHAGGYFCYSSTLLGAFVCGLSKLPSPCINSIVAVLKICSYCIC